jgi:hypothetical protein
MTLSSELYGTYAYLRQREKRQEREEVAGPGHSADCQCDKTGH